MGQYLTAPRTMQDGFDYTAQILGREDLLTVTSPCRDAASRMVKLDHVRIAVRNYRASRDWYVKHLDLRVEFEIPRRSVAALRDDSELTLILEQERSEVQTDSLVLYFQVSDVDAKYRDLSRSGVRFVHPPRRRFWGYGPEFTDPDGYRIRLWDEKTMNAKG